MENLPDLHADNIQLYLNREEIVLDTIAQIMKDFGMFGVVIEYSGSIDNAYEKLHRQLVAQIERLMNSNSDLLMSILYQVDISQREIDRTTRTFPHYNHTEVVAHQIIFRDLKKVLFRRYFSAK